MIFSNLQPKLKLKYKFTLKLVTLSTVCLFIHNWSTETGQIYFSIVHRRHTKMCAYAAQWVKKLNRVLGQSMSNFMWSLHGMGERKFIQTVQVTGPRWLPCPYMVKTLKNLLLLNQKADDLESWYARVLLSLFKWWCWVDLDLFYGKVKFGPLCIFLPFPKLLNNFSIPQHPRTNTKLLL